MWIIYLDKEKCYSYEKVLLSCLKGEEIMEMKEKEPKIIFFVGLSLIHLQCPQLSSCTVWSYWSTTQTVWMWLLHRVLTMPSNCQQARSIRSPVEWKEGQNQNSTLIWKGGFCVHVGDIKPATSDTTVNNQILCVHIEATPSSGDWNVLLSKE